MIGRRFRIVVVIGLIISAAMSFSGLVAQTPVPTLTPIDEANLAVITADNAGQLKPLSSFAEGRFYGFSPDSQMLFYIDSNRNIQEWDIAGGKSAMTFTITGSYGILSVDGKYLTSLTADSLEVWDMTSGQVRNTLQFENIPQGAYLSENGLSGQYLIGIDQQGRNYIGWLVRSGKQVFSVPFLGTSSGNVVFAPDNNSAVLYELDGGLQLVDLANGKVLWSAHSDNLNGGQVVFSPDGKTLALVDTYGFVDLLDATSGKKTVSIPGDSTGAVDALKSVFSPDSKTLIIETTDGVKTYDLSGKAQTTTPADEVQVTTLATSPDGKLALAAYKSVQVLDVASAKSVDDIPLDPGQWVYRAWFSPDGKVLALDSGGTVTLWGVSS